MSALELTESMFARKSASFADSFRNPDQRSSTASNAGCMVEWSEVQALLIMAEAALQAKAAAHQVRCGLP